MCQFITPIPMTYRVNYGPVSRLTLHVPLVGWVGSVGGVSRWGVEKSKKSVRSLTADEPSRWVSGGRLKRVSMNLRMDVVSDFTCET